MGSDHLIMNRGRHKEVPPGASGRHDLHRAYLAGLMPAPRGWGQVSLPFRFSSKVRL